MKMSFTMDKNKTELGLPRLCFYFNSEIYNYVYCYNNPSVLIKEAIENSIPVRKHDIVRLFN